MMKYAFFSCPQKVLSLGLAGYWLIFMHICWPNHGGSGIYLPYNLLAWCFISVIAFIYWLLHPGKLAIILDSNGYLLIAGAAFMTLPILWSPTHETVGYALPRMAGLWAGMAFWLTLRQCRFSVSQKHLMLYALVAAGVIESLVVLAELHGSKAWLPTIWQQLVEKYGRGGVGVFQQVNVTASFLAATLACALLTLGLRSTTLANARIECFRQCLLAGAIVLISAVLTSLYSRAGWLGGFCVIAAIYYLLTFSCFRHDARHSGKLIVLTLCGIGIGLLMMKMSVWQALDVHHNSNHQRLLTLYHTLRYSILHPFLGYGAGTYEGYYQAYLAHLPEGNPGLEMMDHPHNELLYQYAEGGAIALAGALLWCGLYIRLWLMVTSVIQAGALIALFPILLHTQVEYPFYYSAPHWLLFLSLLSLADRDRQPGMCAPQAGLLSRVVKITMLMLTLYGGIISYQGYKTSALLDKFENTELSSPETILNQKMPWVFQQRQKRDLTLLRLITFRSNHDRHSLLLFLQENKKWLSVYASSDMYNNQIAVLNYLGEKEKAQRYKIEAQNTLPWEKSLKPDST
ncbi:PglL family O-oligosaccharyltransferase [Klebsiella aerogenes]|uniref:PglL family O-oligosaccharyltransferase n=1 Tax=Klebsiella aerogenes TaxID=548 RepID=UPI0021D2BC81|nr:Wzy polymerase domain-containing protein [Klebsiella aerogenes]MCU6317035.1 O-antigen ligase C-terminal domain-containing protein [Klebsiella aerogenes]